MNAERLLRTAELLEQFAKEPVPGVEFNMGAWAGPSPIHYCGTAACAVGLAAFDPWFQAEGLFLIASGRPVLTLRAFHAKLQKNHALRLIPRYHGWYNYFAVANFYGIAYDDMYNLFGPHQLSDALKVAGSIRLYVLARQPQPSKPPKVAVKKPTVVATPRKIAAPERVLEPAE